MVALLVDNEEEAKMNISHGLLTLILCHRFLNGKQAHLLFFYKQLTNGTNTQYRDLALTGALGLCSLV